MGCIQHENCPYLSFCGGCQAARIEELRDLRKKAADGGVREGALRVALESLVSTCESFQTNIDTRKAKAALEARPTAAPGPPEELGEEAEAREHAAVRVAEHTRMLHNALGVDEKNLDHFPEWLDIKRALGEYEEVRAVTPGGRAPHAHAATAGGTLPCTDQNCTYKG